MAIICTGDELAGVTNGAAVSTVAAIVTAGAIFIGVFGEAFQPQPVGRLNELAIFAPIWLASSAAAFS